ncbi:TPA: hypothetical protein HNC36_23880 [Escherichia coli]|nr:hypothetical protein [Escherichia coli]EHS1279891.1 hypothetical protein [Escherichia coli]ELQ1290506.1 hypothetical protein [Escherichia coli]HAJ6622999.1 hypothetical protein [Escherichia coli]
MEFKDLPHSIQEIAAHTLRQRLSEAVTESATKEVIDNIARNVRDAFTVLYEEKQDSDNHDSPEKYFLELMDIINKGIGLLMEKKGIRLEPSENHFTECSINSCDLKHRTSDAGFTVRHENEISINH